MKLRQDHPNEKVFFEKFRLPEGLGFETEIRKYFEKECGVSGAYRSLKSEITFLSSTETGCDNPDTINVILNLSPVPVVVNAFVDAFLHDEDVDEYEPVQITIAQGESVFVNGEMYFSMKAEGEACTAKLYYGSVREAVEIVV